VKKNFPNRIYDGQNRDGRCVEISRFGAEKPRHGPKDVAVITVRNMRRIFGESWHLTLASADKALAKINLHRLFKLVYPTEIVKSAATRFISRLAVPQPI
jgi:hypothetical protein